MRTLSSQKTAIMDGPLLSLKELNRLRTVAWDDGWTPLINFQIISLTVTKIVEPLALRQCDVFVLASDINQGVWSKCMINRIPLCSSLYLRLLSFYFVSLSFPHFLQFFKKGGLQSIYSASTSANRKLRLPWVFLLL